MTQERKILRDSLYYTDLSAFIIHKKESLKRRIYKYGKWLYFDGTNVLTSSIK